MIIQLHHPSSKETVDEAIQFLEAMGLSCRHVSTPDSTLLVVYAGQLQDPRSDRRCPGVSDVHHISDEFKCIIKCGKIIHPCNKNILQVMAMDNIQTLMEILAILKTL